MSNIEFMVLLLHQGVWDPSWLQVILDVLFIHDLKPSVIIKPIIGSVLEQDRSQEVLLTQADGGDGAVVELKRGAAVDHHAGVPAA